MNVLGIFGLGRGERDPSACLISQGRIIAMAEEERFTRDKHALRTFAKNAISYCLAEGNISMKEVDCISIGWDVERYPNDMKDHFVELSKVYPEKDDKTIKWEERQIGMYTREAFEKKLTEQLLKCGYDKETLPPIVFKPHHYSHAVSAYLASGFEDASVITLDGHGELNCTVLWEVRKGNFRKIKEFNIPHSLGWYYGAFTRFTGFKIYDGEGKTMGLAPYGNPNKYFRSKIRDMLKLNSNGYSIDPTLLYYSKRTLVDEFSDEFANIFGEYRENDEAEILQHHKDAAFEAQKRLEEVGLFLAEYLIDKTGIRNLCLAGGVALNCKMNGRIHRSEKVDNIFIQPVSGDDGTALGAAMALYLENNLDTSGFKMEHVYYGPSFSNSQIENSLIKRGLTYIKVDNIEKQTAKLISEGNVVGWFQDRMEVGPRALGNRSILADPRLAESQDIVNEKVKFREKWRPFCPSMLEEYSSEYLDKSCYHPFMILTFRIKKEKISEIPSVVHVDDTARPQTVRKEVNQKYWQLIDEFRKITNVPVLLNTSFNIKGEPIVCTPDEAIKCYLDTGIDVLAIGDFLIRKK